MKIGIIGAGASGMMAAITAAKLGAEVTLIEKKDRVGKKILATGNGKCNFTNISISDIDYNSQCKTIYSDYMSQFDEKDTISFFKSTGMLIKNKNGYCYPRSEQASTILDLLRLQLKNFNVSVLTQQSPVSVKKRKKGFEVILCNHEKLYFERIILACGSFAGEKFRDNDSGYTYAKEFGHTIIPVVPALVQVRAKGKELDRKSVV